MRWLPALLLWFCTHLTLAQNTSPISAAAPPPTPAAPQLSPQAAYDQSVRPLDIVRREAANWSDVELAALDVATSEAKVACNARMPGQFAGEDLLAYARLCAFAQLWPQVQAAGTNYLIAYNHAKPEDQRTNFPNLSMAFDYVVQASLHQGNSTNAFGTAQAMLSTVPYDDLASDAVNATVRYVQLIHTDQALLLLEQRRPLILALLKVRATPPAAKATAVLPSTQASELPPATRPPMSIHELYSDAVALPAMQQFADKPEAATTSFAELEAALPTNLSPDDTILTAASRRQYHLLGSPLPKILASAWLLDPTYALPRDLNSKFGAATIFLLFPDWCAQCVAMSPQFTPAATRFNADAVYFYVLLAQADPKPPVPIAAPKLTVKPAGAAAAKSARPSSARPDVPHADIQVQTKPIPAELLLNTPTLIVPPETIDTFVATDFPLLIATDHQGIVRYIQIAAKNAFVPGGIAEQIADRIQYQWPAAPRKQ